MHPHSDEHTEEEEDEDSMGSDQNAIDRAGTFSFGDFNLMKQELDFKGNFYEKVKRNSMMIRESLE